NKKIEYTKLAEEDCIANKTDRSFENVDKVFVETYKEAYDQKYKEIKSQEYNNQGYKDGIKNKIDEHKEEGYKKSYEEGFNKGKEERKKILDWAYGKGYDGKDLDIDDKYNIIKSEIDSAYNLGKKDSTKKMVMGTGVVGIVGISGIGIYRK
ncbi:hypothetical protein PSM38_18175, partial [Clostridioides difficile]|uniref:hypothetical protein n=1 Tax=Clostridioides difficile TaxID=1496 RepID=UPI002A3DC145|nr:hypothetical protein [Clostridioides difficile]